jgi:hypothetical protein
MAGGAGGPSLNNDAHNHFIERTIGPEVFRIMNELRGHFPEYFEPQMASAHSSFPRFKYVTLPENIKKYLERDSDEDAPVPAVDQVPQILIEGLSVLMSKLALGDGAGTVEDRYYFQALLKKTFEAPTHWNKFQSGVGSQVIEMSNKDIFSLIFLGLKKLEFSRGASAAVESASMSEGPAGAGGPGGGSRGGGSSGSSDGGGSSAGGSSLVVAPARSSSSAPASAAFVDHVEKLLDYLRHEEDLTANCGTRYRNSLMMFLQSAGYPGMRIVLSAKDFLSSMMKAFVTQQMTQCFVRDKALYAKAMLQTENTVEALFLILDQGRAEFMPSPEAQLSAVKKSFQIFLASESEPFAFSSKETSEIHALIRDGAAFFDPALEVCPLSEKGSLLFDLQELLSSGLLSKETFAYRGLDSAIHQLISLPSALARGSYVESPEAVMKDLNKMARDIREILDLRRTLLFRKLHKEGTGLSYYEKSNLLFVEGAEAVSRQSLKIKLAAILLEIEPISPTIQEEIKARSSGLYTDIENIFSLLFRDLSQAERLIEGLPERFDNLSKASSCQFLSLLFSVPALTDLDCQHLLKESVSGAREGYVEMTLYDLNRVLIHALRHHSATWTRSFYAVFEKVLNLIQRNFEGSAISIAQGLKEGSYPPFLVRAFVEAQTTYHSEIEKRAHLGGGSSAGGGAQSEPLFSHYFLEYLWSDFNSSDWVILLSTPQMQQSDRLFLSEYYARTAIRNGSDLSKIMDFWFQLEHSDVALKLFNDPILKKKITSTRGRIDVTQVLVNHGFHDQAWTYWNRLTVKQKMQGSFGELFKFLYSRGQQQEIIALMKEDLFRQSFLGKNLALGKRYHDVVAKQVVGVFDEIGFSRGIEILWSDEELQSRIKQYYGYFPLSQLIKILLNAGLKKELEEFLKDRLIKADPTLIFAALNELELRDLMVSCLKLLISSKSLVPFSCIVILVNSGFRKEAEILCRRDREKYFLGHVQHHRYSSFFDYSNVSFIEVFSNFKLLDSTTVKKILENDLVRAGNFTAVLPLIKKLHEMGYSKEVQDSLMEKAHQAPFVSSIMLSNPDRLLFQQNAELKQYLKIFFEYGFKNKGLETTITERYQLKDLLKFLMAFNLNEELDEVCACTKLFDRVSKSLKHFFSVLGCFRPLEDAGRIKRLLANQNLQNKVRGESGIITCVAELSERGMKSQLLEFLTAPVMLEKILKIADRETLSEVFHTQGCSAEWAEILKVLEDKKSSKKRGQPPAEPVAPSVDAVGGGGSVRQRRRKLETVETPACSVGVYDEFWWVDNMPAMPDAGGGASAMPAMADAGGGSSAMPALGAGLGGGGSSAPVSGASSFVFFPLEEGDYLSLDQIFEDFNPEGEGDDAGNEGDY